ncbi:MAG: ABC transporter ATP-binding protein [Bdellovibrionales bacterium]|nr:ABC transporter ATP-binding protein [Bdellovibrionales bacterium]
MEFAVELKSICKSFGKFNAVSDLDLNLPKGKITTLLGPNGAGKSTTIGMILGLVSPTRGNVKVMGHAPGSIAVRKIVGCTPQDSQFPENIKVREILETVQSHYTQPSSIDQIANRFHVTPLLQKNASQLSGGQRRCLALACAFIGNPQLMVLDEPTTGLDVDVRKSLWSEIRKFAASGGTVLLTTHYLEEAESVSDYVVVIDKGHVTREGTPEEIKKSIGHYEIKFKSNENLSFPPDCSHQKDGNCYRVATRESDKFVRDFLMRHDFSELEIKPMSLEDAFLEIIKK